MATQLKLDTSSIRPLDVRRDLPEVADLIELSFSNHMDAEGRDYIRYIRRVANNKNLIRWMPGAGERVSMPLHGYVWEENGRVIGNLTLIPFLHQGRWIYLIANVAVHPEYRRNGIGRMLTIRALEHIQAHQVGEAWLQVRDDNPVAEHLYLTLGFAERARRTTWQAGPGYETREINHPAGVRITSRHKHDWDLQRRWLQQTYPPEVSWNLSFDWQRLRPGFLRMLTSWINGESFVHWAARVGNRLIGTVTWEPGRALSDMIWVGVDHEREDFALESLLTHARRANPSNNYLTVNYPAGRAVNAFLNASFNEINTLIWMSINFAKKRNGTSDSLV